MANKTVAKNPKVDSVLRKETAWHDEMEKLREIVLGCGLTEELKWGVPCYTIEDDRNIVLIHGFKEYCAILFVKGALLKDPYGILIQQTKNVQSARQIRFKNTREITATAKIIRDYIREAVEIEKAGLKVPKKPTEEYEIVEEFQNRLDADKALKKAFENLTPGRQRGYLFYFAQAKQSKTRESRIEKCVPGILAGKGLND